MINLRKVALIFITINVILSVFNLSNADTGVVNTPAVRIREKASTDSSILTKAYEAEEVEILGEEGDWYKVKVNGKTGYASKSLIKLKDDKTNADNNNTSTNDNKTQNNEAEKNNETTENTVVPNIIKEDVSLKLLPNFASNEIKLIIKGKEVQINKELNNWVEITVENTSGWILKNKLGTKEEVTALVEPEQAEEQTPETKPVENKENEKTPEKTTTNDAEKTGEARNLKGTINVETANVRAKADKSSSIIDHLDIGDEVTIVEEIGDWYKITSNEVKNGYVAKTLITLIDVTSRGTTEVRPNTESEEKKVETTENTTATGLAVVEFAKKYLGTAYVLGGKTPETGFDCSGYTRYVFKNFGYSLGTVAASQNTLGAEVSRENLKEGDLILFYNEEKTKIGHTGIYIGGDQFIHSANPERGVVIDEFSTNSYYSTRFVTARRIVE